MAAQAYIIPTIWGATNWSFLSTSTFPGTPSDILLDPTNRNHFWMTYSGYNSKRVAEYDTATNPKWTSLQYNLPNVPVNCIALDTSNWNLYIGTDIGVFYKESTMTQWQAFNNGMPSVRVNDLKINYTTGEIWAATYGRSLWKSPKQITTLGVSVVPFELNSLSVYPNPNHSIFTVDVKDNITTPVSLHIFDMAGRLVFSADNQALNSGKMQVNATGLRNGTYIVEMATANNVLGRNKIVIY